MQIAKRIGLHWNRPSTRPLCAEKWREGVWVSVDVYTYKVLLAKFPCRPRPPAHTLTYLPELEKVARKAGLEDVCCTKQKNCHP